MEESATPQEMSVASLVAEEVYENSLEAIVITNQHNRIVYVNPAFSLMTGYSRKDAIGNDPGFLKSGIHNVDFYQKLWSSLESRRFWEGDIWDKHKLGHRISRNVRISVVEDETTSSTYYVAVYTANQQKAGYHNILEKLAYYDPLTQFPNRTLLLELLDERITKARKSDSQFCIGFVDIDNFKILNDIHGHLFGDEMLNEVIQLIDTHVEEDDIVGRMSGDEFLIIFGLDKTAKQISQKIEKLFESIKLPFMLNDESYFVHLSVGISQFPGHATDLQTLISSADIAMYEAKKHIGSAMKWYTKNIGRNFLEGSSLEREAILAVKNDRIFAHFQPQVCSQTGNTIALEALARWQNKHNEYVPPNKFIPLIEDSGFVSEMFWQVFDFCIAELIRSNIQPWPKLSLNASVNQLVDSSFASTLFAKLHQVGIRPSAIELEITESRLIECFDAIMPCLNELKKGGVSLALDDFGSGFSSLVYLKHLPINKLKLDKTFVDELSQKADQIIVASIIDMAHELGLAVVAEGVETESQFELLKQFGCDFIQGYYIDKPAPLQQLNFLSQGTH